MFIDVKMEIVAAVRNKRMAIDSDGDFETRNLKLEIRGWLCCVVSNFQFLIIQMNIIIPIITSSSVVGSGSMLNRIR